MKMNLREALPWKRLIKVGKPFWTSEKKWSALGRLALVLGLMFANSYLGAYLVTTSGYFMTAIEQRNMPDFWHYLLVWVGLIVVLSPVVQTYYSMHRTRLALDWRSWMSTNFLFHAYLANHAYLKLLGKKDIDNPDQRMTNDLDSFCNTSVGLFISVLDSLTNIIMYCTVLWALMPGLPISIFGWTVASSFLVLWLCKLILPALVAVVATIGNAAVLYIGRELPSINYALSESEASLRFNLAEVRREAEAVALAQGEAVAEVQAKRGLAKVIDTLMRMMYLFRNVQFFTNPYNLLIPIIPTALMGLLYTQGMVPLGTITAATGAFMAVYGGATILMGQFGGIMGYATTINRVGSLMDEMEAAALPPPRDGKHIDVIEGPGIRCENLKVLSQDGERELVVGANFEINKGARVLVTTDRHGMGKTELARDREIALLRAMAGYWTRGTGKLQRLPYSKVMFLTASPYFPPMTLREVLCYPATDTCKDDQRLIAALNMAKLPDLLHKVGLDSVQTWREILSAGDQQRLSLARVILQAPEYVFVDEGTHALEDEMEAFFYTLLVTLKCTVISAGAPNLAKFHDVVVEILPDGAIKLEKASEYRMEMPDHPSDRSQQDACLPCQDPAPQDGESGETKPTNPGDK